MTHKLEDFLNARRAYIENEDFDKLICEEAIKDGILDELLDFLYECGATVSTEAVAVQLNDYYIIKAPALTVSQKAELARKAQYTVNKHQIVVYKTLTAKCDE